MLILTLFIYSYSIIFSLACKTTCIKCRQWNKHKHTFLDSTSFLLINCFDKIDKDVDRVSCTSGCVTRFYVEFNRYQVLNDYRKLISYNSLLKRDCMSILKKSRITSCSWNKYEDKYDISCQRVCSGNNCNIFSIYDTILKPNVIKNFIPMCISCKMELNKKNDIVSNDCKKNKIMAICFGYCFNMYHLSRKAKITVTSGCINDVNAYKLYKKEDMVDNNGLWHYRICQAVHFVTCNILHKTVENIKVLRNSKYLRFVRSQKVETICLSCKSTRMLEHDSTNCELGKASSRFNIVNCNTQCVTSFFVDPVTDHVITERGCEHTLMYQLNTNKVNVQPKHVKGNSITSVYSFITCSVRIYTCNNIHMKVLRIQKENIDVKKIYSTVSYMQGESASPLNTPSGYETNDLSSQSCNGQCNIQESVAERKAAHKARMMQKQKSGTGPLPRPSLANYGTKENNQLVLAKPRNLDDINFRFPNKMSFVSREKLLNGVMDRFKKLQINIMKLKEIANTNQMDRQFEFELTTNDAKNLKADKETLSDMTKQNDKTSKVFRKFLKNQGLPDTKIKNIMKEFTQSLDTDYKNKMNELLTTRKNERLQAIQKKEYQDGVNQRTREQNLKKMEDMDFLDELKKERKESASRINEERKMLEANELRERQEKALNEKRKLMEKNRRQMKVKNAKYKDALIDYVKRQRVMGNKNPLILGDDMGVFKEINNDVSNNREDLPNADEKIKKLDKPISKDSIPEPKTKISKESIPEPKTKISKESIPEPKTKISKENIPDPKTKTQKDSIPRSNPKNSQGEKWTKYELEEIEKLKTEKQKNNKVLKDYLKHTKIKDMDGLSKKMGEFMDKEFEYKKIPKKPETLPQKTKKRSKLFGSKPLSFEKMEFYNKQNKILEDEALARRIKAEAEAESRRIKREQMNRVNYAKKMLNVKDVYISENELKSVQNLIDKSQKQIDYEEHLRYVNKKGKGEKYKPLYKDRPRNSRLAIENHEYNDASTEIRYEQNQKRIESEERFKNEQKRIAKQNDARHLNKLDIQEKLFISYEKLSSKLEANGVKKITRINPMTGKVFTMDAESPGRSSTFKKAKNLLLRQKQRRIVLKYKQLLNMNTEGGFKMNKNKMFNKMRTSLKNKMHIGDWKGKSAIAATGIILAGISGYYFLREKKIEQPPDLGDEDFEETTSKGQLDYNDYLDEEDDSDTTTMKDSTTNSDTTKMKDSTTSTLKNHTTTHALINITSTFHTKLNDTDTDMRNYLVTVNKARGQKSMVFDVDSNKNKNNEDYTFMYLFSFVLIVTIIYCIIKFYNKKNSIPISNECSTSVLTSVDNTQNQ